MGGRGRALHTLYNSKAAGNLMATWNVDTASSGISFAFVHLAVHFSVRHVVEHPLRGRFQNYSLNLSLDDEEPARSSVEIHIDAGSLQTGNGAADTQLRSADVFDVERFPSIAFRSSQFAKVRSSRYRVTGNLVARGVAREVAFDLDQTDGAADRNGGTFACKIAIDAADLGITCEPCWTGVGGASLFDRVDIELEFHATRGRA
jgi:polyisoprenoid-binding protein YceI